MSARLVLWDVAEEHLDEAEFLWDQWEKSLDAPNYALAEVAERPEERLLAHVDGLLAGGPEVMSKLVVPALDEEEPARVTAAAFTLLASGDATSFDAVLRCLREGTDVQRAAASRALEVTDHPGADEALLGLAGAGSIAVQAAAIGVLAFRGVDPGGAVEGVRAGDDPALVIAALRAGRVARQRAASRLVAEALGSADPAVREEAIATGLVLGLPEAWALARRIVRDADPAASRTSLLVTAVGGDARDLADVVHALDVPALRGHALWALGFSGRAAAADACLAHLADPDFGKLAGEAFWAITGLPIAAPFLSTAVAPEPEEPIPLEHEDLDADLSLPPDAALPLLDAGAVKAWWEEHRSRFERQRRYLHGVPFGVESVQETLARGPMRRRHALALEISIRTRGRHHVATRAMTRRQAADLARLAALTAGDIAAPFS